MSRHVIKLECRMADTKVAGTRVQSTEEARDAARALERGLKARAEDCLAGDASVSVLRWKDTGEISNMEISADIDVEQLSVDGADETIRMVFQELHGDRFRRR